MYVYIYTHIYIYIYIYIYLHINIYIYMTRPMHIRHHASICMTWPVPCDVISFYVIDMSHSSPVSLCVKHASALRVIECKQTRKCCPVHTHAPNNQELLTNIQEPSHNINKKKQHEMKVRYKHYCGKPWSAGNQLSATSTLASLFGAAVVALYSLRN